MFVEVVLFFVLYFFEFVDFKWKFIWLEGDGLVVFLSVI